MKSINSLLLTEKEKIEILTIRTTKNELSNNFLLSFSKFNDIKQVNKTYMQLGYAIQLLFLKNLGRKILLNIANNLTHTLASNKEMVSQFL